MCVEMPLGVGFVVGWGLVEAHGVGEAGFKQIVVAGGGLLQDIGEGSLLSVAEFGQGSDVSFGENEGFKRPDRPPGDYNEKIFIFTDDAA